MSSLLEGDSLEVKAIKLHLEAAKQKVTIAKEHADWSNYQLDESKKHLKDVQKKLREAKQTAADDDSGGESRSTIKVVPKRTREHPNRVLQRGVCVIRHGAKRKLCSHPGCTNWAIRFASACSMHGPGRKNTQAGGELSMKDAGGSSSSTEETNDNKQEVQQPPVKKRKTTDISEGGKKVKKLSKSEYDKARREALKAGTWKPDPSKQPKRMRNGTHNTQLKDAGRKSAGETSDNKQGVLQQPQMKKRKTTDISEEAKKAKLAAAKSPKLSKSEYDKARRAAMKAGTWKPDPRYQPKSKRSNQTTMSSGNTSSGIAMLAKAAESDLLHSLFKSNTRVAKDDDKDIMDEDTIKATAQLDVTQTRSGRKITPSSKKREATTKTRSLHKRFNPAKHLV